MSMRESNHSFTNTEVCAQWFGCLVILFVLSLIGYGLYEATISDSNNVSPVVYPLTVVCPQYPDKYLVMGVRVGTADALICDYNDKSVIEVSG